jgi:hypothetical protein
MTCSWLYLASRTTPERFCGKPGHPYCPEHQREIDAMEQTDRDWDETLAALNAVCEEPREEERQLCAACNDRPTHRDCIYCENCCCDDAWDILGPRPL